MIGLQKGEAVYATSNICE